MRYIAHLWYEENAKAHGSTEHNQRRQEYEVQGHLFRRQHVHQRNAEYTDDNNVVDTESDVLGVI